MSQPVTAQHSLCLGAALFSGWITELLTSSVSLAGWFNPSFHHMSLLTCLTLGDWSLETYQRGLTQFFTFIIFPSLHSCIQKIAKTGITVNFFFHCLIA